MIEGFLNIILPVQGLRCVAHHSSKGLANAISQGGEAATLKPAVTLADFGAGEDLAAKLMAEQANDNNNQEVL